MSRAGGARKKVAYRDPPPAIEDRILVDCLCALGTAPVERAIDRLGPALRDRIERLVRERRHSAPDAESLLVSLRDEHREHARPDLSRVHVSWLARGLMSESASVRLTILGGMTGPGRDALMARLQRREADLSTDVAVDPTIARLARTVALERLIGGPEASEDDPEAIQVLTGPRSAERVRIVAAAALAKAAYQRHWPAARSLAPRAGAAYARFRALWEARSQLDPRLEAVAEKDLARAASAGGRHARLFAGATTIARLLAPAAPTRVRWALQHVPYECAKVIRGLMQADAPGLSREDLLAWERRILAMARGRDEPSGADGEPPLNLELDE